MNDQNREDSPTQREGIKFRVVLGLIGLGAFVPLGLLVLGEEGLPKWQQYLAAAVFTPMGVIIEWFALTGRRFP